VRTVSLNCGKTHAYICRDKSRLPVLLPDVFVGGRRVSYSAVVKTVVIQWPAGVRRNVGFVLRRLWQFADVTIMTQKQLVESLVIPYFF
jgi:hypothetical protein